MFKEIIFSTEVVNDIRRAAGDSGDSGDIERLIWELSHVVENYRDGIKNIEYLRPLKEQSGLRLSNIAKHAKAC